MEHKVEVVKVGEVLPHPAADKLDIINVWDYPCIVKKGDFQPGDLGAFVPVDSLVPFTDYWQFVHGGADDTRHRRVKAKKLRGVYSEGILVPLKDLNIPAANEGVDLAATLGITKYEPPAPKSYGGGSRASAPDAQNILVPGFPRYTDIENIRKHPHTLVEGELVVVHEKLHGANFRCGWARAEFPKDPWYKRLWRRVRHALGKDYEFVIGSHSVFRTSPKAGGFHCETGEDLWHRAAQKYRLADKLQLFPNVVLFGEVYGDVQDLKYGHKAGEISLAVFDVYHIKERRFYDAFEAAEFLEYLHIPQPPCIYVGAWSSTMLETLRDGNTLIQQRGTWTNPNGVIDQIREGVVIKPQMERVDPRVGRVILKAVSPAYLLRAGGTEGK